MAQVLELLGDMPRSLALSGKYSGEVFNRRGKPFLPMSPQTYRPSILVSNHIPVLSSIPTKLGYQVNFDIFLGYDIGQ